MLLLSSADFFKINFFKKIFQSYYQPIKRFGYRSGPTCCRSWSCAKLFSPTKVTASKEIMNILMLNNYAVNNILWFYLLTPLVPEANYYNRKSMYTQNSPSNRLTTRFYLLAFFRVYILWTKTYLCSSLSEISILENKH